jgi:hypothetical protein
MSDRLSLSQVAALMAYAAAMAGGQLLFKMAALRGAGDGPLAHASAWLPRFCRTVAIRLVIDIVLIWCGLFFIAG